MARSIGVQSAYAVVAAGLLAGAAAAQPPVPDAGPSATPDATAARGNAVTEPTPTPVTVPASAATPSDPPAGAAVGLEEIVVTAQRRAQNLQDVPVSVSAFRGDTLSRAAITTALGLSKIDSSLETSQQGNVVLTFLRGIGNTSGNIVGNEASVPVYIDDVYYTRLAATYLALANIERVEVLKGPQGTLFGRNSSGGLIQYFTRDPSFTKTALDMSVGYGNYDTVNGKLYASTPLSQDVAIDISAVGLRQDDGWGRNVLLDTPMYREKYYNFRSKLIAKLTPDTTVRLSVFHAYGKSNIGIAERTYRGLPRGQPPAYDQPFDQPPGFYDVRINVEPYTRNRTTGASLKIDQKLGAVDLVSISSWRSAREKWDSEGDHTDVDWLRYRLVTVDRQVTQELQLKSAAGSAFSWILGGYYLYSRQGYQPTEIAGGAIALAGVDNLIYRSIQKINSYAGFGQATFPVVDSSTNITLGLRYTIDDVAGRGEQDATLPTGTVIPIAPDYRDDVTFRKLTYKAVVDHKFADRVMGYVSFSRGYKSGNYNTLPLDTGPTRPEVVDAYEIGAKTELFDRRLRLNLAVFQNDINDPQVQIIRVLNGVASVQFTNAGKARTRGVEFDGTMQMARGLEVRLNGQYLDARYRDFQGAPINTPILTPPFGIITVPGSADGKRLPYSPRWKLNAGVNYNMETGIGRFVYDVNGAYRSNITFDPDNFIKEPKLFLLNASVTLTPRFNERLSIRGFAANLTGRRYYIYELPQTGPAGFLGSPGAPRTYGFEVRYRL